jgi:DNA ligase (NAD+)
MAESIYSYLHTANYRAVIDDLLAVGVRPQAEARKRRTGALDGMTVVVTGSLENYTRQQAEQAIKEAGGKATGSVSRKTDFVLAGKDPGSKLDKARALGIEVIDEKRFMQMLSREGQ